MPAQLKSEYLLDPEVYYLNHGSYGACPRSVFETYQHWQRELERNPVRFIGARQPGLVADARECLASYLGADSKHLAFVTNPTMAFNIAARSLNLAPGDEILTTEYEYPAMEQTMSYIARETGARFVHQPTPYPFTTNEEFVEAFWAGVTEKTRVIFLSHIAPFAAVILPVAEICRRARQAGIPTIVDGAHAPSQIDLNLEEIGADVYLGACHKWISAPKGSAFLYARKEALDWIEPLVISVGYPQEKPPVGDFAPDGRSWLAFYMETQGTRDPSAWLSVPSAIQFQQANDWTTERARCRDLVTETRRRLNEVTGMAAICPENRGFFSQMASVELPPCDLNAFNRLLWEERHIVVPLIPVRDRTYVRFSIQAYNDEADADQLVQAFKEFFRKS